jgi:hypothetical protein
VVERPLAPVLAASAGGYFEEVRPGVERPAAILRSFGLSRPLNRHVISDALYHSLHLKGARMFIRVTSAVS